jgi:hypothetical protein
MADNYQRGHVRKDGTYVQPHYQTAPDRNPYNNYSTQGNTNPYTGQAGTRDPYQVQQQYGTQQHSGSGYSNSYGQQRQRAGW